MSYKLVSINNLSLTLPYVKNQKNILKNINLDIYKQEHTAIIGENGSGKSTLLKLISGHLWPKHGQIFWYPKKNCKDSSPLTGRDLAKLVSPSIQEKYQLTPFVKLLFKKTKKHISASQKQSNDSSFFITHME